MVKLNGKPNQVVNCSKLTSAEPLQWIVTKTYQDDEGTARPWELTDEVQFVLRAVWSKSENITKRIEAHFTWQFRSSFHRSFGFLNLPFLGSPKRYCWIVELFLVAFLVRSSCGRKNPSPAVGGFKDRYIHTISYNYIHKYPMSPALLSTTHL